MDNGCPKCNLFDSNNLCLVHQLEQAEQTVYAAMNEVERIKQAIKKEKQNELSDVSTVGG